jgi:hypothetical protein
MESLPGPATSIPAVTARVNLFSLRASSSTSALFEDGIARKSKLSPAPAGAKPTTVGTEQGHTTQWNYGVML